MSRTRIQFSDGQGEPHKMRKKFVNAVRPDLREAIKEERQVPEIHLDYMSWVMKKEGTHWIFCAQRTSDASCAQHGSMDVSKADGMAS